MASKKKAVKKSPAKKAKKDPPLKVNTSFENLLKMVVNTPPNKERKNNSK